MAYIYDLTDTWNAGGTTFNGIKLNVTDSASAVTSKLVSLQTNGTEHFSVTKAGVGYFSGNVGIGTSSFTNTVNNFVVRQSGTGVDLGGSASTGAIRVRGTSAGAGLIDFYPVSSDPNTSPFYLGRIFYDNASNFMALHTNSAERMRITSSGNVGIGTSSPSEKLNVYVSSGNCRLLLESGASNKAYFGPVSSGDVELSVNGATTPNIIFKSGASSSYTERMRIDSSGGVGVGVVPAAVFSNRRTIQIGNQGSSITGFTGGGLTEIRNNTYLDAAGSEIYASTGSASRITLSNNETIFANAASGTSGAAASFSERARIDASGNLLVGTTSSGYGGRFVIIKNGGDVVFAAQTASGGYCYKSNAANNGGNYYHMEFQENGTARGSISSNGSVVLYNTTSDVRLKYNIENADDASSLIDAIQVRKYDWKADGTHQRYGFVAQELIEVAPEAVSQPEDPDGMMAVDYSKLVPMLVKELQSVRARLAQLEGN